MAVTFRNLQVDRLLREVPAQVLERYGAALAPVLQESIRKEVYFWPRRTIRRFRPPVERGLRDIVDSGNLLRSQTTPQVSAEGGAVRMQIAWPARNPLTGRYYSGEVLIDTTRNGLDFPGRDWITPALNELPPRQFLVQEYRALAGT